MLVALYRFLRQCSILSSYSIAGQLTELLYNTATCGIAFYLASTNSSNRYSAIVLVLLASSLFATFALVCMSVYLCVYPEYFRGPSRGGGAYTLPLLADDGGVDGDHDDDDRHRVRHRKLSTAQQASTLQRACAYLSEAKVHLFDNTVTRGTLLSLVLSYIMYSTFANAEFFNIPGRSAATALKTTDNLCGNNLKNVRARHLLWLVVLVVVGSHECVVLLCTLNSSAVERRVSGCVL